MSRSPYFFVEKYDNNTEKYELQHPIIWNYLRTKQVVADLFPYNACHEMFAIVEEDSSATFRMKGIHCGLPKDVCQEIKKEFDECSKELYKPTARWFTYADMYIYCLEHPEVPDYETMDELLYYSEEGEASSKTIMKPTPLKALKDRVDAFLEVMDGWDWNDDYSQIRIVYWIM